jgi:hypothetical protein
MKATFHLKSIDKLVRIILEIRDVDSVGGLL